MPQQRSWAKGALPRLSVEQLVIDENIMLFAVEKDQSDLGDAWVEWNDLTQGAGDDGCSLLLRIAVYACRDCRDGQRVKAVLGGQFEHTTIATGEQRGFIPGVLTVDRPHGMDDVASRQLAADSQHGLACRQSIGPLVPADLSARLQDRAATAAMDSTIYATAAEQAAVCGIHDGIHDLFGQVANMEPNAAVHKVGRYLGH